MPRARCVRGIWRRAPDEQAARKKYAAAAIESLSFKPRVKLCKRLAVAGAVTRIAGQTYDRLVQCAERKDSLGLLALAEGRTYAEYPPQREIDAAVSKLSDAKLNLVIDPKRAVKPEWGLFFVSLFSDDGIPVMTVSDSWEKHADGVSQIHPWKPAECIVLVALGPERWLLSQLLSRRDGLEKQVRDCRRMREIGDLDEPGYQAKMAALKLSSGDEFLTWAETEMERGISDLLAAEAKDAADRLRDEQRLAGLLAVVMKRTLGKGELVKWFEAWDAYWESLRPRKVKTLVNLPGGEREEENYVMPGPDLPMGPWRRDKVEGADPFKMAQVQIGFGQPPFEQVDLVMKTHDGQTGTISGDFETRGNALRMEFQIGGQTMREYFYFWLDGKRLILNDFGSRTTFSQVP